MFLPDLECVSAGNFMLLNDDDNSPLKAIGEPGNLNIFLPTLSPLMAIRAKDSKFLSLLPSCFALDYRLDCKTLALE